MATPMNIQISGHQTAMTSIQLTTKSETYEATKKMQDVNNLRQHLIDVWAGMEKSIIDQTVD